MFADEDSPVNMTGGFYSLAAVFADEPKLTAGLQDRPRASAGATTATACSAASSASSGPATRRNLIAEWLPALDGVVEKLERGAKVADVGCGHGASTMIMAEAFPNSQFVGIDFHGASIAHAREHAKAPAERALRDRAGAGLRRLRLRSRRPCSMRCTTWAIRSARCKHMPQDAEAGRHADAGRAEWPATASPTTSTRSGASSMPSRPACACRRRSSQEVGGARLGAQAGEKRLAEVVAQARGFTRFRRATETPFNMVLEARP